MNIEKRQLKYIPGALALTDGRREPLVTDPGDEGKLARKPWITRNMDDGSIELVVIGMLAALIVLLAIPLFSGFETPERGAHKHSADQSEQRQAEQN